MTTEKPLEASRTTTTAKRPQAAPSWTGFSKTSNTLLFSLTAGVFAIFCTLKFINSLLFNGRWGKVIPFEEAFWFSEGLLNWAIYVHLWCVLPAGILLPLQFLPVMRRRYITLHKLAGKLLFVLLLIGNITALTMAKRAFGGTVDTQVVTVFLAASTTFSLLKAWISIRDLRIDEHRTWTIRTWSYACSILSLRIYMILIGFLAQRLSPDAYKSVTTCEELLFMYGSSPDASLLDRYPACRNFDSSGAMETVYVVVNASMHKARPEERAALLNMVFGVSGWAALITHFVLTEWFLSGTREEDERLRRVSQLRRRVAGLEPSKK